MSRLLPYQDRWLRDDSRYKIGMFARQCGKTFTSTLEIVFGCVDSEAMGNKQRWVILSRGERQARKRWKSESNATSKACKSTTKLKSTDAIGLLIIWPWIPFFPAVQKSPPSRPILHRARLHRQLSAGRIRLSSGQPGYLEGSVSGNLAAGSKTAGSQYAQRQGKQVSRADDRSRIGWRVVAACG